MHFGKIKKKSFLSLSLTHCLPDRETQREETDGEGEEEEDPG